MCRMDAVRRAPKPIGKIIKRARERKRMSQGDAAQALGVSRSAVNAWENDRAYPRSSLGAIEALYGITLDDAEPEPPLIPPDFLADIWERFPPERAEQIQAAIEAVLRDDDPVTEPGAKRASAG